MDYIIAEKDRNHTSLVEAMDSGDKEDKVRRIERINDEVNIKQWHRYANNLSLNKSACTEQMNVLDFVETDEKGKRHTWFWITDLKLDEMTVEAIMKGGRCRWHIENQTFNTLKNQGYNLEHNYGHGEKHLTTNLAYLTVLAFLVDQTQELLRRL
ncbi:MAG: transposase [Candidatus Endonucleobacter sp. (ex Gigantidas childressi)]|nr:transposase [Candidatus Endonucleobacter sp. (ex Gigantidas childressi)]